RSMPCSPERCTRAAPSPVRRVEPSGAATRAHSRTRTVTSGKSLTIQSGNWLPTGPCTFPSRGLPNSKVRATSAQEDSRQDSVESCGAGHGHRHHAAGDDVDGDVDPGAL